MAPASHPTVSTCFGQWLDMVCWRWGPCTPFHQIASSLYGSSTLWVTTHGGTTLLGISWVDVVFSIVSEEGDV